MKKGRSNVYTEGLACTFHQSDKRICLFELDTGNLSFRDLVLDAYKQYGLDVLLHRSGNGLHFISPTLVHLGTWKLFHMSLKGINPKCPMTTLRIKPNKYPNEDQIWYSYEAFYNHTDKGGTRNSIEVSNLLNKWFFGDLTIGFGGNVVTYPKIVRYPLPL